MEKRTSPARFFQPGDDGHYQCGLAMDERRFADNGDGTVTDNLVGLKWLRNVHLPKDSGFDNNGPGLPRFSESSNHRAGTPYLSSFVDQLNHGMFGSESNGNCGYQDWRIPNINELATFLNYSREWSNDFLPDVFPSIFQHFDHYVSQGFWSRTPLPGDGKEGVWVMSQFRPTRSDLHGNPPTGNWLLPVRSIRRDNSTLFPSAVPAVGPSNPPDDQGLRWPAPRFTIFDGGVPNDQPDDVVLDQLTGLVWARHANLAGPVYQFGHAIEYCENLKIAGFSDWRLPNVNELRSLICYEMDSPALPNTEGTGKWQRGDPFVEVKTDAYWSSTTDPSSYYESFVLDLWSGWITSKAKKQIFVRARESYGSYVLPVRGPNINGCR